MAALIKLAMRKQPCTPIIMLLLFLYRSPTVFTWHRFSAFWLRSKCSICSYQLNIWYGPHWGPSILNWFLQLGEDAGACSDFSTGWPGLAVPPGAAHSPHRGKWKPILSNKPNKQLTPLTPHPYSSITAVCGQPQNIWIPIGVVMIIIRNIV